MKCSSKSKRNKEKYAAENRLRNKRRAGGGRKGTSEKDVK
jgi:hypothetical protein